MVAATEDDHWKKQSEEIEERRIRRYYAETVIEAIEKKLKGRGVPFEERIRLMKELKKWKAKLT